MLKKLRLHNFRTYLNAEFEFTQRHLIIGANNSGKTNLCAAIRFLGAAARTELSKAAGFVPGGISEFTNWSTHSDSAELSCQCEIPFDGEEFRFDYTLKLMVDRSPQSQDKQPRSIRIANEVLTVNGPHFNDVVLLVNDGTEAKMTHEERLVTSGGRPEMVVTKAPRDSTMLSKLYELDTNRRAIAFRNHLWSWNYFSLSPTAMKYLYRDQRSAVGPISSHGENLPQVLFNIKNMDDRTYRRVIEHVKMIEPELEAINFAGSPDQGLLPIVDRQSKRVGSWDGLSDGTIRVLALALIVEVTGMPWYGESQQRPTPLITIEEPENGIFPGQLRRVFDMFEEHGGNAQFLFTTHSPYVINFFDGQRDSVTLLRRKEEHTEAVRIPPASADPDRPLLADEYSMELI